VKKILFIALWIIVSAPQVLFAYNFLYIHPATGEPVGWDNSQTIRYYLDPGSFGLLTNDQARILIQEAIKLWENASPYANPPHFEFAGYLPEDVNGANYQKYIDLNQCYSDDLASCPTEAQRNLQTVIIFDEDNSILNNELCRITSCSSNAGAKVFSGNAGNPGNIMQGIAVFGTGIINLSHIENTMGVIVHEIGHLLGLAHPSLNQQADGYLRPTMMNAEATLNPDDIAGISSLYPSTTFNQTATIKGQILKSDTSPMMHVNVVARNVEDPLCRAYSTLTARECESSTQAICESLGYINADFLISALPPGTYTLEVEEVADDDFASTVAPGLVDSFICGDAEFWNEPDIANEDNTSFTEITLGAGETRENIDITLNRSEVTDDRIKFLPLSTFIPGPATDCPQEPPINYAELIGIEEQPPPSSSSSSGGCSLLP
jgi:hypothetical protein